MVGYYALYWLKFTSLVIIGQKYKKIIYKNWFSIIMVNTITNINPLNTMKWKKRINHLSNFSFDKLSFFFVCWFANKSLVSLKHD